MHLCQFSGIVDSPDNITVSTFCQQDLQRVEIGWNRPYTLSGVDIAYYTVKLDGMLHNVSGNDSKIVTYRNSSSCENQTVCVSVTTLAGTSNCSCIEAFLFGGKDTIAP